TSSSSTSSSSKSYTVASGDTLTSIAKAYGTTVSVPQPIIYPIRIIFMLVKFLRLEVLLLLLLLLRLVLPVVVQRRVLLRAIPSLLEIL
ncbi:LysM peptidoglycan-binding domain-containing protein, partial [Oenococcus oeni]|uniref:LysM peptidoglycan-binding domain-containing protein n=1 Tax=Oenococcus oeni TaxID=1247 RepID=UPI0039C957FF